MSIYHRSTSTWSQLDEDDNLLQRSSSLIKDAVLLPTMPKGKVWEIVLTIRWRMRFRAWLADKGVFFVTTLCVCCFLPLRDQLTCIGSDQFVIRPWLVVFTLCNKGIVGTCISILSSFVAGNLNDEFTVPFLKPSYDFAGNDAHAQPCFR